MGKHAKWLAVGLLWLVVNAILLIIGPTGFIAWASVVIMNLAFALMLAASQAMSGRAGIVFGYPLSSIALVHWVIQLVLTFVVVIVSRSVDLTGWKWFAILQLVLIGTFGFAFLMTLGVGTKISENVEREAQDARFLQTSAAKAARVAARSSSPSIQQAARRVEEAIRYSPAQSSAATIETERLIASLLDQVEVSLQVGDEDGVARNLNDVEVLIAQRTSQIRASQ